MTKSSSVRPANDTSYGSVGEALWRAKGRIIALSLFAGAVAFVALSMMRPLYSSDVRIIIQYEESALPVPTTEQIEARYLAALNEQAVHSQIKALKSRNLILLVVRDLGLTQNAAFTRDAASTPVHRILKALGLDQSSMVSPEERSANNLARHLDVYQLSNSPVIVIEYTSGDPQLAANIANTLADAFIAWQRDVKPEQTNDGSTWLEAQIKAQREATAESEEKVKSFKASDGVNSGHTGITLSTQQLSELNSELILAEAKESEAQTRAKLIRETLASGGDVYAASNTPKSPQVSKLIEQRALLQRRLSELSATLLPAHPRIQQVKSELAGVRGQIRTEAKKTVESLENQAQIAAARAASLRSNLNKAKTRSAGRSDADVRLQALEREAKANRDLLASYVARSRQTSANEEIDAAPSQASIVSRARASALPSFPRRGPVTLLVVAATALLFTIGVFAKTIIVGGNPQPGAGVVDDRPALKAGRTSSKRRVKARQSPRSKNEDTETRSRPAAVAREGSPKKPKRQAVNPSVTEPPIAKTSKTLDARPKHVKHSHTEPLSKRGRSAKTGASNHARNSQPGQRSALRTAKPTTRPSWLVGDPPRSASLRALRLDEQARAQARNESAEMKCSIGGGPVPPSNPLSGDVVRPTTDRTVEELRQTKEQPVVPKDGSAPRPGSKNESVLAALAAPTFVGAPKTAKSVGDDAVTKPEAPFTNARGIRDELGNRDPGEVRRTSIGREKTMSASSRALIGRFRQDAIVQSEPLKEQPISRRGSATLLDRLLGKKANEHDDQRVGRNVDYADASGAVSELDPLALPKRHKRENELAARNPNDLRHYLTQRVTPSIIEEEQRQGAEQSSSIGELGPAIGSLSEVILTISETSTGGLPRTMLVAATSPHSQSPEAAISIARNLSRLEEQVALVDLARGSVDVSGRLSIPRAPGLTDLATGAVDFTDSIKLDKESTLQVIAAGDPTLNNDLNAPERFMRVFEALTQTYDRVVLHADLAGIESLMPALKFEIPVAVAVLPPKMALESQREPLSSIQRLGCPIVIYGTGGTQRQRRFSLFG